MPGPFVPNQTPDWLQPQNASVTDSALTRAMRMIGHLIGADNPTSQVLGLMMTQIPAGPSGGLAGALERLTEKAKTITAYHGSPHDFERFSMEKIGTGEGAQAYGHGLYFAENPSVAEEYKRQLQEFRLPSLTNDENNALDPLIRRSISGSPSESQAALRAMEGNVYYDRARVAIQKHLAAGAPEGAIQGKMYEVAIKADPEAFLDWDKPLSQQSEQVKAKLKESGLRFYDPDKGDFADPVTISSQTGGTAYEELQQRYGGRGIAATEAMTKRGIPGIKYLDQGSRAAGEGSRNYVVFDDSLIDILKKYGVAGAAIEGLRRKAQSQGGSVTQNDIASVL